MMSPPATASDSNGSPRHGGRFVNIVLGVASLVIPFLCWRMLPHIPARGPQLEAASNGSSFSPTPVAFEKHSIDPPADPPPWITNCQVVDLDGDGRQDVVSCDARWNRVTCHYQESSGRWRQEILGENLIAPAHATIVDLDGDGDRDIIVSVLGSIWPNDTVIGKVVWLERTEAGYSPRDLLTDVRRVADVQPGDFDGDGDVDLVVAVFGYARGEILWLEQHPEQKFEPHPVFVGAGTIHVPVADYDRDGDLDFAAVVSQDDEEVWGFENDGHGQFQSRRLFGSLNDDLGTAGLMLTDLDGDGDADLLLPVGDNLEDLYSYPQPYHGCLYLENRGDWEFAEHRIAHFGGTYAAAAGDLDGDSDVDVALVSMFNDWDRPGHASIIWLENDGRQQFTPWQIDADPTHLVTVAIGDLDSDGRMDLIAGSMQLSGPFTAKSGVTAWLNRSRRSP